MQLLIVFCYIIALRATEYALHPHNTTDNITILCILILRF